MLIYRNKSGERSVVLGITLGIVLLFNPKIDVYIQMNQKIIVFSFFSFWEFCLAQCWDLVGDPLLTEQRRSKNNGKIYSLDY